MSARTSTLITVGLAAISWISIIGLWVTWTNAQATVSLYMEHWQ
jgi:hypothetical protein